MKKVLTKERENWQQRCDEIGFYFHSIDGRYWVEDYAIEFTSKEIDELEDATDEIHAMCLDLVDDVVKKGDYDKYQLMPHLIPEIERSWKNKEFHLYGRFDISYDGKSPPKLLEYNADTPTSLIESSVAQWDWLQQTQPQADQFNSIHEKLIERWKLWAKNQPLDAKVHFSCDERSQEEWCNIEYLRDTATQAGVETAFLHLSEIGWDSANFEFVDNKDEKISTLFKLYPWEFLIEDSFYPYISQAKLNMIEPIWKMLLSTKAILPQLWERNPGHPNLLPAFFNEEDMKKLGVNYVKKPMLSREGENVIVYDGQDIVDSERGNYGQEGFIYQQRKDVVSFDNRYSMMGVWMIGDKSCGLGIREDASIITKNTSWFVPHYFKD